jgi:hypothetical protein
MAINYKRCEEIWQRRRGKNWKAVERDCRMTKDGDDFIVKYHGWYAGRDTGVSQQEGLPLLRITPDDIITILSSGEIKGWKQQTTIPNRFSRMLEMNVFRSSGAYKKREHITRIYSKRGNWVDSKPFFVGLQIDIKTNTLLNPKEDLTVVIEKSAVKNAVAKTRLIRKLTMGMARLGAFDDLVARRHKYKEIPDFKNDSINLDEPTGDDAIKVMQLGLSATQIPHSSYWDGNTYVQRSSEEQMQILKDNAVQKGLSLLRTHMYKSENAYVKVPVRQKSA